MKCMSRVAIAFMVALSPAAYAASVSLAGCGLNSLGCFEAEASYDGSDSAGTMTIAITNTSTDGWLTAFAFNNPGSSAGTGSIGAVSLNSAPSNFQLIGNAGWDDGINASPLGQFDIGASTSNSWQGGGNPSRGLAAGSTGVFQFGLTGNLAGLTIASFFGSLLDATLGEYSEDPGIGSYGAQVFAVRFRGFDCEPLCEGSDKAPGSVVPIPPAVALFLSGLGVLAWLRRRVAVSAT